MFGKPKLLVSVAVLIAHAVADDNLTETIQGYKFIESGPKTIIPKFEFELSAAHTALSLLKSRAGPDGLIALLKPDIEAADKFWHHVIKKSTPGQWVAADGQVVAFLPNLTAARFALWTTSPLADAANNDANPEHYVKRTTQVSPGVLQSEILEGWGGVTTLFTIPIYGKPDPARWPMLRKLPDYPNQTTNDKVLRDGSNATFGVLHIAVRDVPGSLYGEPRDGIDIYSSVWYGDGAPEDFLEAERHHMVNEIINLSIQAQKDLESGVFKPPV